MRRTPSLLIVGLMVTSVPSFARAEPTLRPILPRDTDREITTDLQPHVAAIDPAVAARGRLYVHLVGSCGHPSANLEILRHAASLGFHVISINYPNCPSVSDISQASSDPDVHENVRRERLYGVDASVDVQVARPDCIENRLIRAVQFLHDAYPSENWNQFLDGETPAWPSIVIGGHSQGSGHAAFVAKEHAPAGVLLFGGPGDGFPGGTLAPWVPRDGVTPPERMVGFTHAQDSVFGRAASSYEVFGMNQLAPLANVEAFDPPYRRSHILTSLAPPGVPGEFHGCVVVDVHLARDANGAPIYAPVWTHMFQIVTCPADIDSDGAVNSADFFTFLVAFFNGAAVADYNYDGMLNTQDYFDYLTAFFTPC